MQWVVEEALEVVEEALVDLEAVVEDLEEVAEDLEEVAEDLEEVAEDLEEVAEDLEEVAVDLAVQVDLAVFILVVLTGEMASEGVQSSDVELDSEELLGSSRGRHIDNTIMIITKPGYLHQNFFSNRRRLVSRQNRFNAI
jgi:hypothetical protein